MAIRDNIEQNKCFKRQKSRETDTPPTNGCGEKSQQSLCSDVCMIKKCAEGVEKDECVCGWVTNTFLEKHLEDWFSFCFDSHDIL